MKTKRVHMKERRNRAHIEHSRKSRVIRRMRSQGVRGRKTHGLENCKVGGQEKNLILVILRKPVGQHALCYANKHQRYPFVLSVSDKRNGLFGREEPVSQVPEKCYSGKWSFLWI